MIHISTHVLDTSQGRPAKNLPVTLEVYVADGSWELAGRGSTDADGRLKEFASTSGLGAGTYRLTFDTRSYFSSLNVQGLYPQVVIVFEIKDSNGHYHIPLLLSPFGYSTYRGS
jgi:5-hydroxyisourate hydrolase